MTLPLLFDKILDSKTRYQHDNNKLLKYAFAALAHLR